MGLDLEPEAALKWLFSWEWGCLVATDQHEGVAAWAAIVRWTRLSRSSLSIFKQNVCRDSDSIGQIVTVMQTAESWHGYDLATCTEILFCRTTGRRFRGQR